MQESYLDYMQVVARYIEASIAFATEKLSHEPDAEAIAAAEAELENVYQAVMKAGGKIEFGLGRMLDERHGIKFNVAMTALKNIELR